MSRPDVSEPQSGLLPLWSLCHALLTMSSVLLLMGILRVLFWPKSKPWPALCKGVAVTGSQPWSCNWTRTPTNVITDNASMPWKSPLRPYKNKIACSSCHSGHVKSPLVALHQAFYAMLTKAIVRIGRPLDQGCSRSGWSSCQLSSNKEWPATIDGHDNHILLYYKTALRPFTKLPWSRIPVICPGSYKNRHKLMGPQS